MKTITISSLADARTLVQSYNLVSVDLGAGSVEGLAADLFYNGQKTFDIYSLTAAIEDYAGKTRDWRDLEQSYDEHIQQEVRSLEESIAEKTTVWRRLGAAIRHIKGTDDGRAAWAQLAALATSPASKRGAAISNLAGLRHAVIQTGRALLKFGESFPEASRNPYAPGSDTIFDTLLCCDIARLDDTLLSCPPWDGQEAPDSFCELWALFQLLARPEFGGADLSRAVH